MCSVAELPPVYSESTPSTPSDIKPRSTVSIARHVDLPQLATDFVKHKGRDDIVADIDQLTQTIKFIEASFAQITHEMEIIDNKNVLKCKDKPVKFAPRWRELHHKYTKLMIDSQKTARDIFGQISNFVDCHIPILEDFEISLDDKKEAIEPFVEELKKSEAEAEERKTQFLRLAQDIESFRKSLHETFNKEKKGVAEELRLIEVAINEIQNALKGTSKKGILARIFNRATGDSKGTSKMNLDIAGVASLAAVSPTMERKALESLLDHLESGLANELQMQVKDQDDLSASLDRKIVLAKEKLGHLKSELDEILESLIDLDPKFHGMTTKLTAIQGIWQLILMDVGRVMLDLSFCTSRQGRIRIVFERKLKTMKTVYEALQFALEKYYLTAV